jgi:metallo-beta-lactamase family protein
MANASITFLGGAGTVTGSKYLVQYADGAVLIDCGLFQGEGALRRRNWHPPDIDLRDLRAVVLTHAHLDHCGYLPALVKAGWRGPVFATEGTCRLVEIVLRDSAHLMVEEAQQANEAGWSKHRPALPLYDEDDVADAVQLLHAAAMDDEVAVTPSAKLHLGRAGHILGSSWALLTLADSTSVLSSGDLGRPRHPVLLPPEARPAADVVLVESTYGDRSHADDTDLERLAATVRRTAARGGSVVIPAFAVDRTEVILTALRKLVQDDRIPRLPVYVDSPMALASLRVYRAAADWPDSELRPELQDLGGDPFDPGELIELRTAAESMRVNDPQAPCVIISASGMATGGRILHHLRHMLPNPRHTVAIVGFAARGTRAQQLLAGARTVKIHGSYVPVRADIVELPTFSTHADADEILAWLGTAPPPAVGFVVHGEPSAAATLRDRIDAELGWTAVVPQPDERVLIRPSPQRVNAQAPDIRAI